jgi:hypothetical protein
MILRGRRAGGIGIVYAVVASVLLSACASISVDRLPEPGSSYRDGYPLTMEFASVLNLPDRAPVMMNGTRIGVVDAVIPSDVHAVLQQATVLGEIFVALEGHTDTAQGPAIPSGGRIPLAQTSSPPQLEDTLATLAHFVASGSIQRLQNTIIEINRVTPGDDKRVRAIAERVSTNLSDLSDNIETVDQWLRGLADTVSVVAGDIPKLRYWVSPAGMLAFDRTHEASVAIGTLVPAVGSIYTGGFWLVPMVDSLGRAVGEVQRSKWGIEGEYTPWRKLFTDMFLPQDKYPAMNITSVQTADGRDITGNVDDVLRILGAIP